MRRAALLALALLAAPAAQADRFALDFKAAAIGILSLGEITLDFDVTETHYSVDAQLRSRGLLALFEPTQLVAHAEGRVDASGVRPERYELDHHYSRKHRTILMLTGAEGVHATIEPNYRLWGQPPATEEEKRASRDPLSTLVAMAVEVQRTRRCDADFPTFDGRFHYRLELRGGEDDRVDTEGYEGPALHCRLRYVAVSGFEPRDAGRRRVPEGDVWFALVEGATLAPPVRIRAPLPLGSAHIHVVRWRAPSVEIGGT